LFAAAVGAMLKVNDADEALAVAKEMCRKHPELVRGVGAQASSRDVALKIFLHELSATTTGVLDYDASPNASPAASPARAGTAAAAAAPPPPGVFACPYCDDGATRYCKNTGRRHEDADGKARRQWRHLFRQLQIANTFIDTARLNKANTCTEDFAVELDLDDY
jgi:hypothetical protein